MARAGVLVLLTLLISIGAHVLAGGALHVSFPMLLGAAALGLLCVAAADVRRSFAEILAVVALAQPVLHLLASMGGHGDHAGVALTAEMAAGHLAAALAVSTLLAEAERSCWTLPGLFTPARIPTTPLAPPRWPEPVSVLDTAPTPLFSLPLMTTAPGRGPPVVAGAC